MSAMYLIWLLGLQYSLHLVRDGIQLVQQAVEVAAA